MLNTGVGASDLCSGLGTWCTASRVAGARFRTIAIAGSVSGVGMFVGHVSSRFVEK
jgi:hypothetical protein